MSKMAHSFTVAALAAIAIGVPGAATAEAQIPAHVRVVTTSERVLRWLGPQRDVILVVEQGTVLEVLDFDEDQDSFWVILPPDLHGTRKVGWIRASAVEAHGASAAADTAQPASAAAPLDAPADLVPPATSASASTAAEEKVTISVRRDPPASGAAAGAVTKKSYAFEDVHFDRDEFSLRSEDIDRLRAAAAALQDDPSLVVTIQGHTCSLGTGAYNVALGNRRANAVKDYLVTAGVPAERLLTVSQGEAGAEYDNSREETRRLNRRVALVPKVVR